VDSLTFAETVTKSIQVFDSIVLVPTATDTLFGLNTCQIKQAITTDTLYKLAVIELKFSDAIIAQQDSALARKDTIISIKDSEYKKMATLYYECSQSLSTEVKKKKAWRLNAVIVDAWVIVREGFGILLFK